MVLLVTSAVFWLVMVLSFGTWRGTGKTIESWSSCKDRGHVVSLPPTAACDRVKSPSREPCNGQEGIRERLRSCTCQCHTEYSMLTAPPASATCSPKSPALGMPALAGDPKTQMVLVCKLRVWKQRGEAGCKAIFGGSY